MGRGSRQGRCVREGERGAAVEFEGSKGLRRQTRGGEAEERRESGEQWECDPSLYTLYSLLSYLLWVFRVEVDLE